MAESLYEKLKNYTEKNICPMHMPGHKRRVGFCSEIDITEIDGFDNLANPKGVLRDISEKAAKIYGADRAYLSVNGSTGAILASVCALCGEGDKIIMARNCHKSVYNAAMLCKAEVAYIYPEYDENGIAGSISAAEVERAVDENPDAKLLILTSPTYEGVISDIKEISHIAHKRNITVMVDSAHGAHLRFMGQPDAVACGADIVVMSLHKTLPSLTQTALLCTRNEYGNKIAEKLNVFQTSSPSYILMASIDDCLNFLLKSDEAFNEYKIRLDKFYKQAEGLENLSVKRGGGFDFDRGKIVIQTNKTDISGRTLMEKLRSCYGIELEMAYDNYALAMTSVCDTDENFDRLASAICEIDKTLSRAEKICIPYPRPKRAKEPSFPETELVSIDSAKGRICADYVWAYPPGVPIVAPGEVIDEETAAYMLSLCDTELEGKFGSDSKKILVYKNN